MTTEKKHRKVSPGLRDLRSRQPQRQEGYTVFNVEQIEGLPQHYHAKPEPHFNSVQRIEHAETFTANLRANIRHENSRGVGMTGSLTTP